MIYGPSSVQIDGLFESPGIQVGPVFMDSQYLSILVIATLLVLLQYLIFEKTLLGKKMQATSQDKEMASLLGIPVALMIMITFVYSAAMGGLAGMLVAPILFVSVGMAVVHRAQSVRRQHHRRLTATLPGAIVGGLALGVVETSAPPTSRCLTRMRLPSCCCW